MILLSKKTGTLSDTIGRDKMTFIGLFIALWGLLILYFATSSLYLVTIGTSILALSNSILLPISNAIQGDISKKENLASVTSYYVLFKYIGTVSGLAVGLLFGIEGGYTVSIGIFLFTILVTYKVLNNLQSVKEKIIMEQTNQKDKSCLKLER